MINLIKKNLFPLVIVVFVLLFFNKTLFHGLLPIPSDTIVGLYHPFRDYYLKDYPRGVPFDNFLITDPVRQIIPWKELSIESMKKLDLPLWNPYEMAGKPLLGNFQASPFYPLNIILLFKPFEISWSLFIITQPLFAGIFLFYYLKNFKLDPRAALFGSISFAFGGFSIAWLEWGNVVHTALWLPLILLAIDKQFEHSNGLSSIKYQVGNVHLQIKKSLLWLIVLLLSFTTSFFAGHLQIFFYIFLMSVAYYVFRWFEKKSGPTLLKFIVTIILFVVITSIQWIPTSLFIFFSARSIDQNPLSSDGWFIPFQNLVQFIVPDFFGNPATLNYWGVWNYGEFVGYIGIIGLFFAFLSFFSSKKKEALFFVGVILASLLLSLPNPISQIPFNLSVPFLSSAQPTRLIFLMTFSLSVLSAFGLSYLANKELVNKKAVHIMTALFILTFLGLFILIYSVLFQNINSVDLSVAKRNLIFPSGVLIIGLLIVFISIYTKSLKLKNILIIGIIIISFYDLFRFGNKFLPFTPKEYFYPSTKVIEFLQKDKSIYRIASTDSRILPPNFSTHYKIQSIEGYDPLYLKSYAELIAASEREDHSIKPPFGFNRIITPHNFNSPIIDLLNVKYILSFSDLSDSGFKKVFQEGQTKVYENLQVLPRTYFVKEIITNNDIKSVFLEDLGKKAVVSESNSEFLSTLDQSFKRKFSEGKVNIVSYESNTVIIETQNEGEGFLVFTDTYYPTWRAKIDGKTTPIFKTNHAFRGIIVPAGKHEVIFYNSLF